MDPFIFSLVVAWLLVRGSVEDTIYAARGRPSPRQQFRQRYGPSGAGKVARAASDRLAQRIAQPKGTGPARRYFSELWTDSLESAGQKRRERAERREARRNGEQSPPRETRWWQWRRPKPSEQPQRPEQSEPVQASAERFPPGRGCWHDLCIATDHGNDPDTHVDATGHTWTERTGDQYCPHPECREYKAPHTHEDDNVLDAELVDEPAEPAEDGVADRPPDPTPKGDPATATVSPSDHDDPGALCLTDQPDSATENGAPSMSNNNVTIVAAEGSLAAYRGFAEDLQRTAADMVSALETTAASMASQEYGEAVTGPMAQAQELAAQIAALMAAVNARLEESTTVADSYAAADHTGTKESLLAG